ncbi:hypothetical protein ACSAZL_05650 [Methanosarcina sp. T3]|uniref:hypothetical protein n=1 Tax=Methanosarcina sp. T3 TaxID=3439062 RepID=UPI003F8745C3
MKVKLLEMLGSKKERKKGQIGIIRPYFSFKSFFLSIFAGPPDGLAEALVFTVN